MSNRRNIANSQLDIQDRRRVDLIEAGITDFAAIASLVLCLLRRVFKSPVFPACGWHGARTSDPAATDVALAVAAEVRAATLNLGRRHGGLLE